MTTSLRIIERSDWETVRERYRELAYQDRPGDPLDVPAPQSMSAVDRDCLIASVLVVAVSIIGAIAGAA